MARLIPVESSNIAAIGHEDQTLIVNFHSGESYSYYPVDRPTYLRFLRADSKGKFFQRVIRNDMSLTVTHLT